MAQILLAAAVFQGSNLVLGNGLRGLGQPGKTALSEGAGVFVTIILLVLLLPVYGGVGTALASFCAYALVWFLQMFFVRLAAGITWRDFWRLSWKDLFPDIDVLKKWRVKLAESLNRKN